MSKNSNLLELKTSNYFINYVQYKPNEELIKLNEDKNSTMKKVAPEKEIHKKRIVNTPLRGISAKMKSPEEKQIKRFDFSSSKIKIGYLKHFNNNSIYYSNHKTNDYDSKFKNKYTNTEIKQKRENLEDNNSSNKNNLKKLIYFKTSPKFPTKYPLQNGKRKNIVEDSKNNTNIDENQKINNFFNKFNYINIKNGAKKRFEKIKAKKAVYQKKENKLKVRKKLLNVLSKENLLEAKNDENINTLNISTPIKSIKSLIEMNQYPEKIIPKEYKIINTIGSGSFGKIYKVKWNKNNNNYAMKVMHFENKDKILYQKGRVKLIMDYQKKVKNDGLIKIYGDFCYKKGKEYNYYKLMELAESDWEQEIKIRNNNNNYYSEKELLDIMIQLIKTLTLLQKNHITHRDIKLQNILLINNKYKICDFGESRKLNQKGVIIQPIRGSELYMSPILFFGLNKDLSQVTHNTYKSDVFSLGMCILYAAGLCHNSLYEIREMTDMNNIKNILEKYLSKRYSKTFIELVLSMLEINERKRPDFIQLEKTISQLVIKY